MKKIMTSALLLLALCVPAFTQNASDFTVDADGVITKYIGFDTVIVIPAVIGGKNITGIGKEAFLRADLTRVTIPEGITWIGQNAFSGNKLTAITIPNSVMYIGESAFANNRLTSVTIPGSVKEISEGTFSGNTALAKIVISEGVEEIGYEAFANTKCTSVSLPSTITYISSTFDLSGKPSFTLAANIPATFDFIPAFYSYIANDRKAGTYASNLPIVRKNVEDYEYLETRYGAVLISYTGNSTRVRIPATIGGVAVKALYGMNSSYYGLFGAFQERKLVAVQIPESITYIGRNTFSGNELASVTIPNSVTYLSGFNNNQLTSVTIPNSVTYIADYAFSKNQLTSVTIPNKVTYIGKDAFKENKLTSITIPNSVTLIYGGAFRENALTSVTIGSNVRLLSYEAYGNFYSYAYFPFEESFIKCYNNNNESSGTYTYANYEWVK